MDLVDDLACPRCDSRSLIIEGFMDDGGRRLRASCHACGFRWVIDEPSEIPA